MTVKAGVVSLPAEVWGDLLRSDGNGVYLQAEDLGTLVCVLGALESRKLPALDVARGLMRLEDDDNTLVLVKGLGPSYPWGSLGDLNGLMAGRLAKSLKHLGDKHCKWLSVTETAGEIRIRRGVRMEKFLERRREVGS